MNLFTWSLQEKFAEEFENFPFEQQKKISDFLEYYSQHGLSDFSVYEGKITPSWATLLDSEPRYHFAKSNHLWHYHIGIPKYESVHPKYKTSEWVLHFQWKEKGAHIDLVDLYTHYTLDGTFYLPSPDYLD